MTYKVTRPNGFNPNDLPLTVEEKKAPLRVISYPPPRHESFLQPAIKPESESQRTAGELSDWYFLESTKKGKLMIGGWIHYFNSKNSAKKMRNKLNRVLPEDCWTVYKLDTAELSGFEHFRGNY